MLDFDPRRLRLPAMTSDTRRCRVAEGAAAPATTIAITTGDNPTRSSEELESPLQSATIGELESHFELRRQAARGEPMHPRTQGFLRKGNEVFAAPRFIALYHRWLKHGDAVFAGPSSPAIAEALSSGRGHVESVVLPHPYRHLAPWLQTRRRDPSQ